MTTSMRTVRLPVGSYPRWELDDVEMNPENAEWHNIAESLVVLQSLKQSRDKWLTSAFAKFSGKARGSKQPEVKPPPHSIKAHNRLELVIGPHVFANTALYEIHYLSQEPIPSSLLSKGPHTNPPQPLQPQSNPNGIFPGPPSQQTSVPPLWPPGSPIDPNSSLSQSRLGEWVTPALLTQVTRAVGTDPLLRSLLELAQRHQLTDDQRANLTTILRSLSNQVGQQQDPAPEPQNDPLMPTPHQITVQPFDLVIEFQEKPSDRWVVPRSTVQLEDTYAYNGASRYDVILSTRLPTSKGHPLAEDHDRVDREPEVSESVKLHWRGLPQTTYDILIAWSRGEPEVIDMSVDSEDESDPIEKTYLPLQLPDGDLFDALQAIVSSHYAMKFIKPANADSNRSRRRTTSRKQATQKPPEVVPMKVTAAVPSASDPAPPSRAIPTPVVSVPLATTSTVDTYSSAPFQYPLIAPTVSQRPAVGWSATPTILTPPEMAPSTMPLEAPPQPTPDGPMRISPDPAPVSRPATYTPLSVDSTLARPVVTFDVPVVNYPPPRVNQLNLSPILSPHAPVKKKSPPLPQSQAPAQKKRKTSGFTSPPGPPPITCRSCGKRDVPLLMGGRICRPCLDAGLLPESFPDPPARSSSSGSTSPAPAQALGVVVHESASHVSPSMAPSQLAFTVPVASTGPVPVHTYSHLAAQNQEAGGSREYHENIQKWYHEQKLGSAEQ